MKSTSFTVELPDIDVLEQPMKETYSEGFVVANHSGDVRLYLFEKFYLRTSSDAAGVVFIESLGDAKYSVQLWALGGKKGLLGLDYGAENQFLKEMKDIVIKFATNVISDTDPEFA